MKIINLKYYYPFYTADFSVEIPDEIAELFTQPNQKINFNCVLFKQFQKTFKKVWQFCNSHRNSGERETAESPPERG